MKKTVKIYLAIWFIAVALFNVLAFVVPAWGNVEKFETPFFIGYGFIMLVLFLQLVLVLYFIGKTKDKQTAFLRLNLINIAYMALIASIICGGICMVFTAIPVWIAVVLCAIVAAIFGIAILKTELAVSAVQEVGRKYKQSCAFIRQLSAETEVLIGEAKTERARACAKKVYEAVRYSDPVSSDSLRMVELQIENEWQAFAAALRAGEEEKLSELADKVLSSLNGRNVRCKTLKN